MEQVVQIKIKDYSESLRLSYCLTLSGGFFDAYTYICRDGVFANAETGNMVLLGVHLAQRDFTKAFIYLIPIVCFALGVFITEGLKRKVKNANKWKQVSLIIESLVLIAVSLFNTKLNIAADALISFICGIQVNSFRRWHSNPFATTMCTGNLRSAVENTAKAVFERDNESLKKCLTYYSIIFTFIIGAVTGTILTTLFGYHILFVSVLPLLVSFILLSVKE